ncbi:hypothetical protein KI387_044015, partial [Taxus chinensis]
MGRRDNRWGEVDFSLGGGEGNDNSRVDGRITSVDGSLGWEADDETTSVERVGSSMRARGDKGDSSVGGVEE